MPANVLMLNKGVRPPVSAMNILLMYPERGASSNPQAIAPMKGGNMYGITKRDFISPLSGMSLRPISHAKKRPTTVPRVVTKKDILTVFHIAARLSGSVSIEAKRLQSNDHL